MGKLWQLIRKQLRGKTMVLDDGMHQNYTYEEFEIERACNNLEKNGIVEINQNEPDQASDG